MNTPVTWHKTPVTWPRPPGGKLTLWHVLQVSLDGGLRNEHVIMWSANVWSCDLCNTHTSCSYQSVRKFREIEGQAWKRQVCFRRTKGESSWVKASWSEALRSAQPLEPLSTTKHRQPKRSHCYRLTQTTHVRCSTLLHLWQLFLRHRTVLQTGDRKGKQKSQSKILNTQYQHIVLSHFTKLS